MADTLKLKTMKNGLVKSYLTYDASSRMEYIYEAPADAADGASCLVTQYVYSPAPSTNIVKMKESAGTWIAAAMDIP